MALTSQFRINIIRRLNIVVTRLTNPLPTALSAIDGGTMQLQLILRPPSKTYDARLVFMYRQIDRLGQKEKLLINISTLLHF